MFYDCTESQISFSINQIEPQRLLGGLERAMSSIYRATINTRHNLSRNTTTIIRIMCEQYVVIIILYKVNSRRSYYFDGRPHMKNENRVLTISVKFNHERYLHCFIIFYFLFLLNNVGVFFTAEMRQGPMTTALCLFKRKTHL